MKDKPLSKKANRLQVFNASDGCLLAEVFHPRSDPMGDGVSLARASLPPGGATSPHRLDFVEIYYFLSGRGVMHAGGERLEVEPDSAVHLPPGSVQWLENPGPAELVFLCICHPAYDPDGDHSAKKQTDN